MISTYQSQNQTISFIGSNSIKLLGMTTQVVADQTFSSKLQCMLKAVGAAPVSCTKNYICTHARMGYAHIPHLNWLLIVLGDQSDLTRTIK